MHRWSKVKGSGAGTACEGEPVLMDALPPRLRTWGSAVYGRKKEKTPQAMEAGKKDGPEAVLPFLCIMWRLVRTLVLHSPMQPLSSHGFPEP